MLDICISSTTETMMKKLRIGVAGATGWAGSACLWNKPEAAKLHILSALKSSAHVVAGTSGLSVADPEEIHALTVVLLRKFAEIAARNPISMERFLRFEKSASCWGSTPDWIV
jgi:hypothetical protein